MGEAKVKQHYEAMARNDERVYFKDPSDPNGEIHIHEKFRRMEAMYIVLMRAYVRSGMTLPIVMEGKILDAENRVGVESGLYSEVANAIAQNVDQWRAEADNLKQ